MSGVRDKTKQPELLRRSFIELMKNVCTSIPGHILTFDPDTQLAQVQVGIQRVDINDAVFQVGPIIETPVYFPGGDFCLEYQIDPGCEGDILFSQRCIDGWIQSGGIAANPIGRFHNMQDACFLPGFRSMPNVLPAFQNNGIRLRNRSGNQFAWLKNNGDIAIENPNGFMRLLADGSMAFENAAGHIRLAADGIVTINGVTIAPDSLVTAPNDILTGPGNVSSKEHAHYAPDNTTPLTGRPIQ